MTTHDSPIALRSSGRQQAARRLLIRSFSSFKQGPKQPQKSTKYFSKRPRKRNTGLARIIREVEDARSLFCYKHVVKAVFVLQERLPACSTIARHSVCYFPTFFTSLPYCSSTNGGAVPMAGPFC